MQSFIVYVPFLVVNCVFDSFCFLNVTDVRVASAAFCFCHIVLSCCYLANNVNRLHCTCGIRIIPQFQPATKAFLHLFFSLTDYWSREHSRPFRTSVRSTCICVHRQELVHLYTHIYLIQIDNRKTARNEQ